MTSKILTAAIAIALGSSGAFAAPAAVMECCCCKDKMAGDKKPGEPMDMPAPAPAPTPKK